MNASTCTGYVVTQQHMIIPLHFSLFLFKAIEGKKKSSSLFCFLRENFIRHTPMLTSVDFQYICEGDQLMMNNFNLLRFQVISHKIRSFYVRRR